MKIKIIIVLLVIFSAVQIRAGETENASMAEIIKTLDESIAQIDDMGKKIEQIASTADSVKAMTDKMDFSSINSVKKEDVRSKAIAIFEEVIAAASLTDKESYLSRINKMKADLGDDLYKKIATLMEQVYTYKKLSNETMNGFATGIDEILSLEESVSERLKNGEAGLNMLKGGTEKEKEDVKKHEKEFEDKKALVLEKIVYLNDLQGVIDEKVSLLGDINDVIITKLSSGASAPAGDIDVPKEEQNDLMPNDTESNPAPAGEVKDEPPAAVTEEKPEIKPDVKETAPAVIETKPVDLPVVPVIKEGGPDIVSISADFQKGIDFYKENNAAKAQEYFLKEVTQNPDNYRAYNYLAKIYIAEKKYDLAVEEINKALQAFKKIRTK
ncbi:MAG: tetratricopeptide repeat protein [Spirochaetes bacterium]|nr:tetratricopeptide repeat protein [Spirochaetota bacterium]